MTDPPAPWAAGQSAPWAADQPAPRLVVIGAGDLGGRVAARWVARGGRAVGVTASEARHPKLIERSVEVTTDDPTALVQPGDVVVLSTPGSERQREIADRLRAHRVAHLVFVSTTGYYEGSQGLLSERSPPGPTPRAQAAALAERAATDWCPHATLVRLGGLYRLGRGPTAFLRRSGAPLPGPAERPLALIHVDDAATAILTALTLRPTGAYVGVVPPLPTREAFYRLACATHGLPEPAFEPDPEGTVIAYDASAFLRDLLPEPQYPDWREATRG